MATAKTPKKIPAATPAAVKSAPPARAMKAKPAPARAAAAKAPEDAIVHSAEVAEPVAPAVEKIAETAAPVVAKVAETAAAEVDKAAEAVTESVPAPVPVAPKPKQSVVEHPSKAVAAVAKAADKAEDTMMKGVVPFIDFSRDNAILLVAAGNQVVLSLHKMSQSLIDWSAESCDKAVAAGQAMLSAKGVEEVLDLSQSLAKEGFDQLLKEGSELSALSSKLIEDTIVPLPGRLVAAVEKLASHAA